MSKPANWSSMTRAERSAWNKAAFRQSRGGSPSPSAGGRAIAAKTESGGPVVLWVLRPMTNERVRDIGEFPSAREARAYARGGYIDDYEIVPVGGRDRSRRRRTTKRRHRRTTRRR